MKEFEFSLQLKGEENKVIGNIVQNDTANLFVIRIKDGITPFQLADTDIITVTYRRGNDTVVVDSMGGETVTVTDYEMGEINIIPHSSAVVNVGMVTATVEVYDEVGGKLTSARFSFTVTPDAAANVDASEDSEFPALQNLISYTAQKNTEFEISERARVANEEQRTANEQERQQTREQMKTLLEEGEKLVSMDVSVVTNTPSEYVLKVTDKDGSFETPNLMAPRGSGSGDMLMEHYDTNGDGKVNDADMLDGKKSEEYMLKADYDSDGDFTVDNAKKLDGKKLSWFGQAPITKEVLLPVSGWTGSGPYTQIVAVDGILQTDNPVADVVLSGTEATAVREAEAWGHVSEITTADNSITVKCLNEKPEAELNIRLLILR